MDDDVKVNFIRKILRLVKGNDNELWLALDKCFDEVYNGNKEPLPIVP